MSPKAVSTSVRGIGVAVITSMSGASPLAVMRKPLVDAEAVLLVDDGEDQVVVGHRFLEQRMGADDDVDLAARPGRPACRRARGLFRGR